MARAANVQAFIDKHARQFEQIQLATKLPPSAIVAQSALETGWGGSTLYTQGLNLFAFRYYARHVGFITLYDALGKLMGKYARYDSYDESAEDYIWLLTKAESSTIKNFREWAGYTAVLRAAEALYPGTSDRDATLARALAVCEALGASKFCEGGGYNNTAQGVGGKLKQIILANDLIALDPPIHIAPYIPGQPGQPGPPVETYPGDTLWYRLAGDLAEAWGNVKEALAPLTSGLKVALWVLVGAAALWGAYEALGRARNDSAEEAP